MNTTMSTTHRSTDVSQVQRDRDHAADLARYEAKQAAKLAMAAPVETPAPKPSEFTLATASETVTFRLYGDLVIVTHRSNRAEWPKQLWRYVNPNRVSTLTLPSARAEYHRLLKSGYKPW